MRIIAGTLRSRRLAAPLGSSTRPTTDRARESLFNVLAHMLDLEGITVLDLFAGSGALGIEALSRGAGHVTAIERDRGAFRVLEQNRTDLELTGRMTIFRADAYSRLPLTVDQFDLILADAPYEDTRARTELPSTLVASGLCKSSTLIVIEHRSSAGITIPEGAELVRTLKAGEATFSFLRLISPSQPV